MVTECIPQDGIQEIVEVTCNDPHTYDELMKDSESSNVDSKGSLMNFINAAAAGSIVSS